MHLWLVKEVLLQERERGLRESSIYSFKFVLNCLKHNLTIHCYIVRILVVIMITFIHEPINTCIYIFVRDNYKAESIASPYSMHRLSSKVGGVMTSKICSLATQSRIEKDFSAFIYVCEREAINILSRFYIKR